MCGIAGILTARPAADDNPSAVLTTLRDALKHRGPDGDGTWIAPSRKAAFAHTRLAIFDPGPSGHQPMSTPDGRFTIVYNGALYNHLALRRQLEQDGAVFTTRTDTEVVLKAFAREGSDCLHRLRGMFAFAIWDNERQSALLVRDRLGIKPLYYAAIAGGAVFASELRAIVRSGLVPRTVDVSGLDGYFRTGSVPEPRTLLEGVRCLPAGHHVSWTNGRLDERPYVSTEPDQSAGLEAERDIRAALETAVSGHCRGDRPVAILLSGGVDSSALLALGRAAGLHGLHTLSMALPGAPEDEAELARRTAAHFGATHHECAVTATTARDAFSGFLGALDQPSVDGLNTFVMARFARQEGLSVMLSGIGADELFGGYPTFRGVPRLAAWHRRIAWSGGAGRLAGRALQWAPDARARRVGDLLTRTPCLEHAYETYRGIFTRAESRALIAHYLGQRVPDGVDRCQTTGADAGDAVGRLELTRYVRNQLLRDGDVMSMASGVELRVPFLDQDVVERVCRVPSAVRLAPGKSLLRRTVPELPPWVGGRAKRCFQFPIQRWTDGEWSTTLRPSSAALPVPLDTWYRRWCVLAFEAWMRNVELSAHA